MPPSSLPKVSCLLVTADRPQLVKRALRCYANQTYENTELVVLDNGETPIQEVVESFDLDGDVVYRHVEREPDMWIGALRNQSLELATGKFVVPQWDDDDWSHPERVERQARVLQEGYDACTLQGTLMHVDSEEYFDHPFIGPLPDGVPPTIMHRRNANIRYPNLRRTSDTDFVNAWQKHRYKVLPIEEAYLYLRYSHGGNLWEQDHFLRRMRNTPKQLLLYAWHAYIRGDVFNHPRFRLTSKMEEAFELYLEDSIASGIFDADAIRAAK
ncbi:glycosyl transferase family 2 [Longibacter salinarum]|uniref:Glycosyl transferase family 2 n=1 Tax=Longibacter salinarum TaxID=1850348 RepID=A0A2A8CVQ0_9BACT|nr:glycosyltransferase family A protein [Longibacter salinarum]PEN12325.1 glycosyl transferase family 2 [Longibacter salinarum]